MRQISFDFILWKAKSIIRSFDKMKVVVMSFVFVIRPQGVAKSGSPAKEQLN